MDHHISSSSSINSLLLPAKAILGAVILVVLIGCISHDIVVAGEICTGEPADHPTKYKSWVRKVLNKLVKGAPRSSTKMMKAYYPNKKNGSVTGAAICYTADEDACRSCLQNSEMLLVQCTHTAGGYFDDECNMEFWEVGSI
ncbi:hypothetical protein LINGRAHAP2_LOCUS33729 [Linum grandiflorum]